MDTSHVHPPVAASDTAETQSPVADVIEPAQQTLPLVLASPHSGVQYPDSFLAESKLDRFQIRKSEDSFVDELVSGGPLRGAPLLRAHFPRAYVDPNREPFELDAAMFDGPLPDYVNTASPRVAAGLGTIARVVCSGAEIYAGKLSFGEALRRINTYYRPYHQKLESLLHRTHDLFDCAVLIDCHSMPSIGGPMDQDPGRRRVDFVLGDCHGVSCNPRLTDFVQSVLEQQGYVVRRNLPYAGGFTTRHYGRPAERQHALQIEINRAIYMNEDRYEKLPYFGTLANHMTALFDALSAHGLESLIR